MTEIGLFRFRLFPLCRGRASFLVRGPIVTASAPIVHSFRLLSGCPDRRISVRAEWTGYAFNRVNGRLFRRCFSKESRLQERFQRPSSEAARLVITSSIMPKAFACSGVMK